VSRGAIRESGEEESPRNETQVFNGNDSFEFDDWAETFQSPLFLLDSFFDWKRIVNPERYFRYGFSRIALPASDYFYKEASRQGLQPNNFTKVIVTVAHFIERAASDYPTWEVRRAREEQIHPYDGGRKFRAVPFGEIFSVLGSNAIDPDYQSLYTGTSLVGDTICTEGGQYVLPVSDFKTHSRFIILALSFLIEVGVLHIDVKSYPVDATTRYNDARVPYDRRVHWFTELIYRYDIDLSVCTYCFTPHEEYSDVAWHALVNTLTVDAGCLGTSSADALSFNTERVVDQLERSFDYALENYWCPVIRRNSRRLTF
jgi:hypothetical protein